MIKYLTPFTPELGRVDSPTLSENMAPSGKLEECLPVRDAIVSLHWAAEQQGLGYSLPGPCLSPATTDPNERQNSWKASSGQNYLTHDFKAELMQFCGKKSFENFV